MLKNVAMVMSVCQVILRQNYCASQNARIVVSTENAQLPIYALVMLDTN